MRKFWISTWAFQGHQDNGKGQRRRLPPWSIRPVYPMNNAHTRASPVWLFFCQNVHKRNRSPKRLKWLTRFVLRCLNTCTILLCTFWHSKRHTEDAFKVRCTIIGSFEWHFITFSSNHWVMNLFYSLASSALQKLYRPRPVITPGMPYSMQSRREQAGCQT